MRPHQQIRQFIMGNHFKAQQPASVMSTERLMKAAQIIKQIKGAEVTGIEFEDGSGYKFNYQINGGKWQFIELDKINFQ